MRQLHNYLGVSVFQAIAVVVFFLLALEIFFTLVNEIRYVGTGDYGFPEAIAYLLLKIPQSIYRMFPLSALLGCILGVGVLASNSELVAMRAAGVSYVSICTGVLKMGLFLCVIVWVLGEVVAPRADRLAQNQRALAMSGGQAMTTEQGTWMRDGSDFVHVQSMHVNGELEGITRYHFNDDFELEIASHAKTATRESDYWRLKDVEESRFHGDSVDSAHLSEKIWRSDLDPEVLRIVGTKYLEELSLGGLYNAIVYREANGLEYQSYSLAFWEKIFQPLVTLLMMVLGVTVIFGPLRNANLGLRILLGFIIGFVFYVFNHAVGPMALLVHIPPVVGALIPTMVMMTVVGVVISRIP